MYSQAWFLRSKKPQEIASFETLLRPMEPSLWAFTMGFSVLIFISLYKIQKFWCNLKGQKMPQGHLFQGKNTCISVSAGSAIYVFIFLKITLILIFSLDFNLTFIWIDEPVPYSWFHKDGFTHSRKLLLLFWLVMGDFIKKKQLRYERFPSRFLYCSHLEKKSSTWLVS